MEDSSCTHEPTNEPRKTMDGPTKNCVVAVGPRWALVSSSRHDDHGRWLYLSRRRGGGFRCASVGVDPSISHRLDTFIGPRVRSHFEFVERITLPNQTFL